jgi:hypothetical protein
VVAEVGLLVRRGRRWVYKGSGAEESRRGEGIEVGGDD